MKRIFTVAILFAAMNFALIASAEDPVLPKGKTCQGKMELGGKTYKFEHAVAYEAIVFDEPRINVLLSDKPIAVDKLKAALVAGKGTDDKFSVWQPHTRITFGKEGKASFTNAWADNFSVSISGSKLSGELKIEKGQVSGKTVLTDDKDSKYKSSWEAVFEAPLIELPKELKVAKAEKPKPSTSDNDDDDKPAKPTTKVAAINAHELPIPKDATDVEFKELVGHISFKTKVDHKAMAAQLTKDLEKQGWAKDGSDLLAAASCILRRKRGDAELTIFVKPAAGGSTVQIMSEGLNWEKK